MIHKVFVGPSFANNLQAVLCLFYFFYINEIYFLFLVYQNLFQTSEVGC